MLAVVRVFSTNDLEVRLAHSRLIQARFGLETVTYCIPDQPYGIHDEQSEAVAVPKIVAIAKLAEAEGAKAIFISCAADPAVAECREAVSIPVLGAGSAAAAASLAAGYRVGVLNLNGPTPTRVASLLGNRLTAYTAPENVANTTDLLTEAGRKAAIAAAQSLAEQVDVIMLACTGFTTIGLASVLRTSIRVPIIDAVEAGAAVAKLILNT